MGAGEIIILCERNVNVWIDLCKEGGGESVEGEEEEEVGLPGTGRSSWMMCDG